MRVRTDSSTNCLDNTNGLALIHSAMPSTNVRVVNLTSDEERFCYDVARHILIPEAVIRGGIRVWWACAKIKSSGCGAGDGLRITQVSMLTKHTFGRHRSAANPKSDQRQLHFPIVLPQK